MKDKILNFLKGLKRGNWKETIKYWLTHPFAINVYIGIGIFVVLLSLTIAGLKVYTHHGEEITLPNLTGKTVAEAQQILEDQGLTCEVVDSLFKPTVPPGTIVDQVPGIGDKVKKGRTIYLYIRASRARQIPLPDLHDLSERQAQSTLESVGLSVQNVVYVPSEYKDLVLGVSVGNRVLIPGTRLVEGTAVTLKVGKGTTNEKQEMPSLRSLTIAQATQKLKDMMMSEPKVIFDTQPKSEWGKLQYFVYKQTPITDTELSGNESVTIYVTTDKTKLDTPEEKASQSDAEPTDEVPSDKEE
jgi:beta-lactam-binding protein with PASTA domain